MKQEKPSFVDRNTERYDQMNPETTFKIFNILTKIPVLIIQSLGNSVNKIGNKDGIRKYFLPYNNTSNNIFESQTLSNFDKYLFGVSDDVM
jgi:hypothetical protein